MSDENSTSTPCERMSGRSDAKSETRNIDVLAVCGGSSVTAWTSQWQHLVVTSTTKAEIAAASEGSKDLTMLKRVVT
ncbi:hypothetical protein FQR65_LT11393 [Abscondita terminalis]|nr:hypothetical protein FQR65_LT11393 [Abscondita terminalis]